LREHLGLDHASARERTARSSTRPGLAVGGTIDGVRLLDRRRTISSVKNKMAPGVTGPAVATTHADAGYCALR
jgi:hypothetical protein